MRDTLRPDQAVEHAPRVICFLRDVNRGNVDLCDVALPDLDEVNTLEVFGMGEDGEIENWEGIEKIGSVDQEIEE